MADVMELFAAFAAGSVLATVAGVLVLRWRLVRRNRVSPSVRSAAPLRWLWSPEQAARLHRRLRAAVAVVRVEGLIGRRRRGDDSGLPRVAAELEQHAVALDQDLAVAARLPARTRRAVLGELAAQVAQLEWLSARVATAASTARPSRPAAEPTPVALARLHEELDSLEAARDEIARLEASLGLTRG